MSTTLCPRCTMPLDEMSSVVDVDKLKAGDTVSCMNCATAFVVPPDGPDENKKGEQMSMIDKAMNDLREAILVEHDKQSRAHRDTLTEMAGLRVTAREAAEILHHGVPRLGELSGTHGTTQEVLRQIDKKIERAWNLLDKMTEKGR